MGFKKILKRLNLLKIFRLIKRFKIKLYKVKNIYKKESLV